MGVLDRFPGGQSVGVFGHVRLPQEVTVTGVQRAIRRLHDAGIMIGSRFRPRSIKLEVLFPFPGFPVVVRNLHRQTVSTALGVIADQNPMPVFQRDDLRPGTGIRQRAVGDRTPRLATIARFALVKSFRGRAVIAHEREQRSILAAHNAGLNVAAAHERRAGMPVLAPIIRDGHERK